MPVLKEPTVHYFGIVTNEEHEKIQWRKWEKYQRHRSEKNKPKTVQRNPFQLTEEFIEGFNDALNTDAKEEFIELARKMLARCKRRAGLRTLGCGKHVDLTLAWVETAMLSQCKGEIQEEALDILLASLDHAPVSPDHIAALFFLAEFVLYRICFDTAEKPQLFPCEIKLSKVATWCNSLYVQIHSSLTVATSGIITHYVEGRLQLLLLHLSGYLEFCGEQKSRLHISVEALAACQISYQLYPNISFTMNFMLKAGEAICEMPLLCDSSLAPDADLEEGQKETFQNTPLTTSGTGAALNSGSEQSQIKPFLWHSLLVWVCVHNSCSEMDEVLKHVLFYKEQLHQKDWLESVLGLMVLGEAAKLNMSCLKVLMDLVRDFISGSMPLQKQPKSHMIKCSCWQWQVGYIYTNILREICVRGISADVQKTAFLGFCDCAEQFKNDKKLRGASFHDLLHYCPSADDGHDPFWVIRYGVIYNLVILHSELSGDVIREGLRNAVWKSLQKQKDIEKKSQVLDAMMVAEIAPALEGIPTDGISECTDLFYARGVAPFMEMNMETFRILQCLHGNTRSQLTLSHGIMGHGCYILRMSVHICTKLQIKVETKSLTNRFHEGRGKGPRAPKEFPSSQYIAWRITTALCHHVLPPIGPDIPLPRQPVLKPQPVPYREPKMSPKQKTSAYQSIREKFLQPKIPKHPDFFAHTDMQLRKIMEDQWETELQLRLALEEKLQQLELKEKQKLEEERFRRIMKWRWTKLRRTTKPYELSGQCDEEEEEMTEASGSSELSSV